MTMGLVRGLTTLNTSTRRKKKRKYTDNQLVKLRADWKKHNKHMKELRVSHMAMTFEEYLNYIQGYYKPKSKPVAVRVPWHQEGVSERPETESIPSRKPSFAPCTKKESMKYTGERKLIGIATLHKSNMVPVFADDDDKTGKKQATEIAQMRRN